MVYQHFPARYGGRVKTHKKKKKHKKPYNPGSWRPPPQATSPPPCCGRAARGVASNPRGKSLQQQGI